MKSYDTYSFDYLKNLIVVQDQNVVGKNYLNNFYPIKT